MPVKVVAAFGFVIAKVRLVLPPAAIEVAPKSFVIDGGASTATLGVPTAPASPEST
jgi:hypothetical protein